jgi:hypothetical protein
VIRFPGLIHIHRGTAYAEISDRAAIGVGVAIVVMILAVVLVLAPEMGQTFNNVSSTLSGK